MTMTAKVRPFRSTGAAPTRGTHLQRATPLTQRSAARVHLLGW